MKGRFKTGMVFISKSMLWSFMLYIVFMLLINWEEVNSAVTKRVDVTVVEKAPLQIPGDKQANTPASISSAPSVERILTLLRLFSPVL